jgi:predicted AAA+ superfamily ATPase
VNRDIGKGTGGYVRRVIDDELDDLMPELPAILLDGPKGVGKTATASQRAATVRRMDVVGQGELLSAGPGVIATDPKPVLLDEWQRLPALWDAVRRLVDDDGSGGQYLLTGSAPITGTHSGAGRIVSLRMRPLCFEERRIATPTVSFAEVATGTAHQVRGSSSVSLADYVREILAGGFPGIRALSERARVLQLNGYLERIVDHDLPEAGFTVRRPAAVMAWLRAYAAATATTASWETVRDAATSGIANKPSRDTVSSYTELLTQLRILDGIPAWSPAYNHFKRLASAPKHHLADPALAARLLGRTARHLLSGKDEDIVVPNDGTLLGNLFESLVALSVRAYAQANAGTVYHLRFDAGRHEVDFIVEFDDRVLAVEAKLSGDVSDRDARHLHWLRDQLGDRLVDAIVVTAGTDAYRRADGIAVVPLALLGA